jgi:hypothetical protein
MGTARELPLLDDVGLNGASVVSVGKGAEN